MNLSKTKQKALQELEQRYKEKKEARRREIESKVRKLWFDFRERKKSFRDTLAPAEIINAEIAAIADVNSEVSRLWREYKEQNNKELPERAREAKSIFYSEDAL